MHVVVNPKIHDVVGEELGLELGIAVLGVVEGMSVGLVVLGVSVVETEGSVLGTMEAIGAGVGAGTGGNEMGATTGAPDGSMVGTALKVDGSFEGATTAGGRVMVGDTVVDGDAVTVGADEDEGGFVGCAVTVGR